MARPWVKGLLAASLALNLLVVGGAIGIAWRGTGHWRASAVGPAGPGNLIAFVGQLPKERREQLFRRASDMRAQIREQREVTRVAAREVQAALTADTFDKGRYVAAQTRQIDMDAKFRALLRDAAAEIAVGMTTEERRALTSWRQMRRLHGPAGGTGASPYLDDSAATRP